MLTYSVHRQDNARVKPLYTRSALFILQKVWQFSTPSTLLKSSFWFQAASMVDLFLTKRPSLSQGFVLPQLSQFLVIQATWQPVSLLRLPDTLPQSRGMRGCLCYTSTKLLFMLRPQIWDRLQLRHIRMKRMTRTSSAVPLTAFSQQIPTQFKST